MFDAHAVFVFFVTAIMYSSLRTGGILYGGTSLVFAMIAMGCYAFYSLAQSSVAEYDQRHYRVDAWPRPICTFSDDCTYLVRVTDIDDTPTTQMDIRYGEHDIDYERTLTFFIGF